MEEMNWLEEWLAAGGQVPDKDAEIESRPVREVENDPDGEQIVSDPHGEESWSPSGLYKPDGRSRHFPAGLSRHRPARSSKQYDWLAEARRGRGCYRAMERWLERQSGQPWDEVYSRLCENFDRRTRIGRRIRQTVVGTYGMVDEVDVRPWARFGTRDGILYDREAAYRMERKPAASRPQAPTRKQIELLLRGRQVMRCNGRLYWVAVFRRRIGLRVVRDRSGNALDLWGFPEVMRVQGKRLGRREEAIVLDYIGSHRWFNLDRWLFDQDALAA